MSEIPYHGRCMCGAVSYTMHKAPNWCGHCHCGDCRKHVAGVVATFIGCDKSAFELTGTKMAAYSSSAGVTRLFCGACGTPMAYENENMPGEIHLLIGTLDDPAAFEPQVEVFCGEKLPWLKLQVDGLSFDALPELT